MDNFVYNNIIDTGLIEYQGLRWSHLLRWVEDLLTPLKVESI